MELENTGSEDKQWPAPLLKVLCVAVGREQSWCVFEVFKRQAASLVTFDFR